MRNKRPSRERRAQGMPDAGRTHGPPAKGRKQAALTTGKAGTTGIPCAMVLTAASCSPRSAGLDSLHRPGIITRDLIPASGDQDHTTWPSARMLSPARERAEPPHVHRTPPPYVRDDRDTPLQWRRDGERIIMDFGKMEVEYFCGPGLT